MVIYRLLVAGAKQKWSKIGSFFPMAGAKQKLSKLGPITSSTAIPSPPYAVKRRLPEFATVGLYSMFAGVCGGAGYAAYANSRVDARRDGFITLERDSELGEPLWILYKKKTKEHANHDDDEEVQQLLPFPLALGRHKTTPSTRIRRRQLVPFLFSFSFSYSSSSPSSGWQ